MKKYLFSIIGSFALLFLAPPIFAQEEVLSPAQYLDKIRQELSLGEDDPLHCEDVTKDQRGALGQIIFTRMHPDASQEILLRKLMGMNERNPEEMYLRMGSKFLDCDNIYGPETTPTEQPWDSTGTGKYQIGGYIPMGMGMMGMAWGQEWHWGNYLGFMLLHGIGWLIFLALSAWIIQKVWKRS